MSSQVLLKEGLIWRIGNGCSVQIWGDRWLPSPTTYAVQSPKKLLPDDAKVCDLIDSETNKWDQSLIQSIFSQEEAEVISTIPLSKYGQPDLLLWRGTSTGVFTVRSAYHMEVERHESMIGESSYQGDLQKLWNLIWGLNVPNPVKMFTWRACHNILPTWSNLQKKGIALDPLCLFCQTELETVRHVLWDCPSASDVWGACDRKIQKSNVGGDNFSDVVQYMFDRCSHEEVELHVEVARRIWFRRNIVVHGGEFTHPNSVILLASTFITDFRTAFMNCEPLGNIRTGQDMRVAGQWRPPPPGVFKLNWDAALDSKKRKMGFGFLVRDSNGKVFDAVSCSMDSFGEPVVAESMAALRAVTFCRYRGLDNIIFWKEILYKW
jgi:hypothetical protein